MVAYKLLRSQSKGFNCLADFIDFPLVLFVLLFQHLHLLVRLLDLARVLVVVRLNLPF
jgi:hypothetical protein